MLEVEEDVDENAGRTVPLLSLAPDRILQQAASTLMFARAYELAPDQVSLGRLIGRGGFGHCYHAQHQGQQVVSRELGKRARSHTPQLLALAAQAEVLQKLVHPHVLRVVGARTVVPRCFLVMELAPHGSLHYLLHTRQVELPPRSLPVRASTIRPLHAEGTA